MTTQSEQTKNNKVSIQHGLFYSQITLAMNAARIIKCLALGREFNHSEREILAFAQLALVINVAKIWDKSHFNIRKFIDRRDISETERATLKSALDQIEKTHKKTIDGILKWRHELAVHLDKELTTMEKFKEFDNSDLADIQKMLHDVANFVCSVSWYPEKNRPMAFLDYSQIKQDLKL